MKKRIVFFCSLFLFIFTGYFFFNGEKITLLSDVFLREPRNAENYTEEEKKEEVPNDGTISLSDEQMKHLGIHLESAKEGDILNTLSTRAKVTIDPDAYAHVLPKLSGIAKEIRKKVGDTVRAGELLTILESQEMADLKSNYLTALSRNQLAHSTLERESSLYKKGISSGEEFLRAKNNEEEAKIQVDLYKGKLLSLGLSHGDFSDFILNESVNLRDYPIYAPIDGTILMRHLTQGEMVETGTLLFEIANFKHLFVEMAIYPSELSQLKIGQQLEVKMKDGGLAEEAHLIYISPLIEDHTIAAKAIALLDNREGKWRSGSIVTVSIVTDQIKCPVTVCNEAIQKIDGKNCIFIQTEKGFEKRELTVGKCDAGSTEVISGLKPGERYVSDGSFLLKAELNKALAEDDD